MRLPLTTLFASLLTVPAFAANAPLPAPAAEEKAVESTPSPAPVVAARSDNDVKVCRMVREIGSNRASRVCKTKAQIERESETARANLNGPAGDKSF